MGSLTLGVNSLYRVFCFFKLFIIGGKGLRSNTCTFPIYHLLLCDYSEDGVKIYHINALGLDVATCMQQNLTPFSLQLQEAGNS